MSIERMCAGREFQVEGADTEKAREEKLLVIPAGLVRRFVLEERKDRAPCRSITQTAGRVAYTFNGERCFGGFVLEGCRVFSSIPCIDVVDGELVDGSSRDDAVLIAVLDQSISLQSSTNHFIRLINQSRFFIVA